MNFTYSVSQCGGAFLHVLDSHVWLGAMYSTVQGHTSHVQSHYILFTSKGSYYYFSHFTDVETAYESLSQLT